MPPWPCPQAPRQQLGGMATVPLPYWGEGTGDTPPPPWHRGWGARGSGTHAVPPCPRPQELPAGRHRDSGLAGCTKCVRPFAAPPLSPRSPKSPTVAPVPQAATAPAAAKPQPYVPGWRASVGAGRSPRPPQTPLPTHRHGAGLGGGGVCHRRCPPRAGQGGLSVVWGGTGPSRGPWDWRRHQHKATGLPKSTRVAQPSLATVGPPVMPSAEAPSPRHPTSTPARQDRCKGAEPGTGAICPRQDLAHSHLWGCWGVCASHGAGGGMQAGTHAGTRGDIRGHPNLPGPAMMQGNPWLVPGSP